MRKDYINDYGGTSRYRNNKEQEYREIKKKYVLPERLDRKSTMSSVNDEIEITTTKSKDRTTAAQHNE